LLATVVATVELALGDPEPLQPASTHPPMMTALNNMVRWSGWRCVIVVHSVD
jgi:hypothetical protein